MGRPPWKTGRDPENPPETERYGIPPGSEVYVDGEHVGSSLDDIPEGTDEEDISIEVGGGEVQETVEKVDELLQGALEDANMYRSHDEVRPSAIRAFDKIHEARKRLDDIDERDFNEGDDGE